MQKDLEYLYSKQYIECAILDVIDIKSNKFIGLVKRIDEYKTEEYSYASKNTRVQYLNNIPSDEIALRILIKCIPCNRYTPIQAICSALAYKFSSNLIDGIKTAAELLAVTEGLYFDLYAPDYPGNNTGQIAILSSTPIPEDKQEEIDITQYLPPMMCKPRNWKNKHNGGYLTIKDSVLLNSDHSFLLNLKTINTLQKIKFKLNSDILAKEEEVSAELTTTDQLEQFNIFKEQSRDMYELFEDKPLYFVWKYDSRGRMYSQGYHINIQGSEYKRALIDFHREEVLT